MANQIDSIKNNKPSKVRGSFWIILVVLFIILIGVILFWVIWGSRTGIFATPDAEEGYKERTDVEIISELEGVQIVIENYFSENDQYPIKLTPTKVFDMREEVSGLSGYDENRLKSAGGKDFLYQTDEEGTKYALFAVLPEGSSQIKKTELSGFPFPDGGYNFYLTSK